MLVEGVELPDDLRGGLLRGDDGDRDPVRSAPTPASTPAQRDQSALRAAKEQAQDKLARARDLLAARTGRTGRAPLALGPGPQNALPAGNTMDTGQFNIPFPTMDTGQFSVVTPTDTGQFSVPQPMDTGQFNVPVTMDTGQFSAVTPMDTGQFSTASLMDTGQFNIPLPTMETGQFEVPYTVTTMQPPAQPPADTGQFDLPYTASVAQPGNRLLSFEPLPTDMMQNTQATQSIPVLQPEPAPQAVQIPQPVQPTQAMPFIPAPRTAPEPAWQPQQPAAATPAPPASPAPAMAPAMPAPVPTQTVDSGYATKVIQVLAFARAQIGKPCLWGAVGPGSYDNAGLTQAAWKVAGVALPRTAPEQAATGTEVPLYAIEPGDLVFFHDDLSHVGLCTGNGMMIHAPGPGAHIREESIYPTGESIIRGAIRPA
ncbi:C40 family peptidase [Streptomyces sp. NPDC047072]|uniref:C40 family peptidase n=1 Tax=Streptomyces sp. NPDC047072 TaxID=3154809 RepID=UPI0033C4D7C6